MMSVLALAPEADEADSCDSFDFSAWRSPTSCLQSTRERRDLALRVTLQSCLDRVLVLDDLRTKAVERRLDRVIARLRDGDRATENRTKCYPRKQRETTNSTCLTTASCSAMRYRLSGPLRLRASPGESTRYLAAHCLEASSGDRDYHSQNATIPTHYSLIFSFGWLQPPDTAPLAASERATLSNPGCPRNAPIARRHIRSSPGSTP